MRSLVVLNWNIAAVNNNPFEYWVTHPNPEYNEMMRNIQDFIDRPEKGDVLLGDVFTHNMWSELKAEMKTLGLNGIDEVEVMWKDDYSQRRVISDFLLDKVIGIKRLISMPDRITNTINNIDGSTALRPSVISTFEGEMGTFDKWWSTWKEFMFRTSVHVLTKTGGAGPKLVCNLIEPILRSKYPAISPHEQLVSIPLQVLCLAMFDAALLYVLNTVALKNWQAIKRTLTEGLVKNKGQRTCAVLAETYSDAHIIFIQEAAAAFQRQVLNEEALASKFIILRPNVLDGKRDQNSFILASREVFEETSAVEVTEDVIGIVGGTWIAPGDLMVVTIRSRTGYNFLLASFHGDSNGLSTQPFVQALDKLVASAFPNHCVIIGLDANTHNKEDKLHFGVSRFHSFIQSLGITSCWGDTPDPTVATTCNARTCLQSQVNKAVRFEDRTTSDQKNLKDWVLFYGHQYSVTATTRDNTGNRIFVSDIVFPTIDFPSDHAVVCTQLTINPEFAPKVDRGENDKWDAMQPNSTHVINLDNIPGLVEDSSLIGGPLRDAVTQSHRPALKWLWRRESRSEPDNMVGPSDASATLYDYWNILSKPEELQSKALNVGGKAVWSLHDSKGQHDFLEEQFLNLTQQPPDVLDKVSKSLPSIKNKDSAIWILFTSNPISLALSKPWFQAMHCAGWTMAYVWCAFYILLMSYAGKVKDARHFRFTVVEDGGNCSHDVLDNILGAGLLIDGYPIEQSLLNFTTIGTSLIVSASHLTTCNGFWFSANKAYSEQCPLRFAREHSFDGVSWEWTPVSVWEVNRGMLGQLNSPDVKWLGSDKLLVTNDFRPTWGWSVGYLGAMLALITGHGIGFFLAVMRTGRDGVMAISASCGVCLSLRAVCFIDAMLSKRYADAFMFAMWFLHDVYGCWSLSSAEWLFIPALLGLSAFYATMEAIDRLMIHTNAPPSSLWFFEINPQRCCILLFMFTYVLFLYIRRSSSVWVRAIVEEDEKSYDSSWERYLVADRSSRLACDKLNIYTKSIQSRLEPDVRQRFRRIYADNGQSDAGHSQLGDSVGIKVHIQRSVRVSEHGPLVKSLDRLYAQAAGIHSFFISKVQDWALASQGCFPVVSASGDRVFTRWESILDDPAARAQVQWPKLKTPDRALEKLLRSYQNDPSRLLDCCRQWIVFEEARHLLECLEAIERDEDVVVERVKNRLHAGYDSGLTAGYRDVMLNLRISTEDTRRLGLETHVCELQLAVRFMAELKNDERHKRYLIFRNLRSSQLSLGAMLMDFNLALSAQMARVVKVLRPFFCREKSVTPLNCDTEGDIIPEISLLQDLNSSKIPFSPANSDQKEAKPAVAQPRSSVNQFGQLDSETKSAYLRQVLERTYAARCQNENWQLDDRMKNLCEVIGQASTESLLSTGNPIAASLSRRSFRIFLLGVALIFALQVGRGLVELRSNGVVVGAHFRQTIKTSADSPNKSYPFNSINLLFDGFRVDDSNATQIIAGQSLMKSLMEPVAINGWRLFHATDRESTDIEFMMESSWDGQSWYPIASKPYDALRFDFYVRDRADEWYSLTPTGKFSTFDLRMTWQAFLEHIVVHIVDCIMTIALPVCGAMGYSRFGPWIFGVCSFLNFLCFIASAAGYVWGGQLTLSFSVWMLAFGKLCLAFTAMFYERMLRSMILFHGILMISTDAVHSSIVHPRSIYFNPSAPTLFGISEVLFWLLIVFMQLKSYIQAKRIIERDTHRYDAVWAQVFSSDSSNRILGNILELTCKMGSSGKQEIRQYNRFSPTLSAMEARRYSAGVADAASLVESSRVLTSLDQLYAQAAGLHPFLKWKVQDWALASKGCFPVVSASGDRVFTRWESILDDPAARAQVQWPKLKTPDRALEKLLRSYQNDPSRLLDCCRQWIVFEEARHLLECLEAIERDEDVVVERVKNRLHAGYDSGLTAGYRDVMLNLRISTEDTRRLGLETHVCELQLVLKPFASIKTMEGHRRYIMFRDKRGL